MAQANSYSLRPKHILLISTTMSIVLSDILMIYLIFQQSYWGFSFVR